MPRAAELCDWPASVSLPDGGLPFALHVEGGADGETLRPLDFAPVPGRPARRLFTAATIDAELRRLAEARQDDGGWPVDFASHSPAATLEWRGYTTVGAVSILRGNAVI